MLPRQLFVRLSEKWRDYQESAAKEWRGRDKWVAKNPDNYKQRVRRRIGGWKEATDDNKDVIGADLWSCVDYSTLKTLIFLHQREGDTAAIFQHCPLQTGSGGTTEGGRKRLEWGVIWRLTRQMHLQIIKNVNAKCARLKNIPSKPSHKDADGEWHSCIPPIPPPPSPNLTCTLKPGSEQERGNLADQSQYAVLWKWSVNKYSWRAKKSHYEEAGDDWCRLWGKYKKLASENSWHKKNHPCWWLLCFNTHQICE